MKTEEALKKLLKEKLSQLTPEELKKIKQLLVSMRKKKAKAKSN